MKVLIRKAFLADRVLQVMILGIFLCIIVIFTTVMYGRQMDREVESISASLTEMQSLSSTMVNLKNHVSSKEKRLGLTKTAGPVSALEKILETLLMKASELKPLEKRKLTDFFEEDARLEITDIDLNQIVNLLYRIEQNPAPLKIKSAQLLTGFEDSSKFTLTLTVSLISKS
ncbi:MAG: hypothetical protein JSV11_10395 [Nitrospiraceae bacterium]|nr:MAG: hypothetical protein JSV11_10395 [Nitrospiraceae bacterium]